MDHQEQDYNEMPVRKKGLSKEWHGMSRWARLALLVFCAVGLLMALVGKFLPEKPAQEVTVPTYQQVNMEEAISIMEQESDYVIVDVRTAQEFAAGHIPDAINIANEDIVDTPPEALPDLDQLILIYCRSGNRSKQASEKLVQMGYTNIIEFGGIIDWPGEIVTE